MKHGHEGTGDSWSTPSNLPDFISTHPSYETRISNFQEWMPEAMIKFEADDGLKCRAIREEMKMASQRTALEAPCREDTSSGTSRT